MIFDKYISVLFVLLLPMLMHGQDTTFYQERPPAYDSLHLLYPFLKTGENKFNGAPPALNSFYRKLDRIKNGSPEQAVVVHIGDSHVQPGIMTQALREWLQATFGNAGRGMMFPYRVAKSNGPAGYVSHCDTPWIYCRNAALKQPFPTGISGFTLCSNAPSPSFTIEFTTQEFNPADTARLTIFHENRDSCFSFYASNEITGHAYRVADSTLPDQTTMLLDDQPQKLRIRAVRTRESQKSATFYGMSLEKPVSGVIVHTIGVNGAMFSNYLESENFVKQLSDLKPDLLIFSLGTNEAFGVKSFSPETFHSLLDSLFLQIRRSGNQAEVVLATPPGIYKSSRKKRRTTYKPNPLADTVSEVLRKYAADNNMALWDWYTIMGGKDAMAKWKAKKLTDRKYIHFSGKGYGIQGELLRQAMLESYEQHENTVTKQTSPGK
ncbi:MAG: GDSL-type esterase/lipase family protein [bacterium]